jgi:E3 ubiquitin-protein ligase DOA10
MCRFCWEAESTDANPRIAACNCIGSMKYIHLNCLKSWLNIKLDPKVTENLISYYWKTFECEVCKVPYPYILKNKADGTIYRLINFELPEQGPFLIIESIN